MNNVPVLEMQSISKSFRKSEDIINVLNDFCISIAPGEFVGVQGPSGCGKTTLLLTAGGLLEPEKGKVFITGFDFYSLTHEKRAKIRARAVGFVFQQFHLLPYLNVIENILTPTLALPGPGSRQKAEELVAHLGLSSRARHLPSELSTGERQRTALARALMNNPKLILADEPTGNLDRDNAETVLKYLADFSASGGAVLLATHGDMAASFAHRNVTLEKR